MHPVMHLKRVTRSHGLLKKILFGKSLPGRGHSSPVHDGNNIWVTTALETPASEERKGSKAEGKQGITDCNSTF